MSPLSKSHIFLLASLSDSQADQHIKNLALLLCLVTKVRGSESLTGSHIKRVRRNNGGAQKGLLPYPPTYLYYFWLIPDLHVRHTHTGFFTQAHALHKLCICFHTAKVR